MDGARSRRELALGASVLCFHNMPRASGGSRAGRKPHSAPRPSARLSEFICWSHCSSVHRRVSALLRHRERLYDLHMPGSDFGAPSSQSLRRHRKAAPIGREAGRSLPAAAYDLLSTWGGIPLVLTVHTACLHVFTVNVQRPLV